MLNVSIVSSMGFSQIQQQTKMLDSLMQETLHKNT